MSASSSNLSSTSTSSSTQSSPSSNQSSQLPKKKARIFSSSNGLRARQRAVVFNATNYFNGDSTIDEFNFSEPIAPVFNQAQDTPKARRAHQCHESGESNQMNTDIEYFIESLDRDKNSNDTRCLGLLGLAKKVMSIEYRMHLRAHDEMPKIMTKLTDAPDDPSLALSFATLMFIHNQDKMNPDIDPTALKLMLNIINSGIKNVDSIEGVEKKHKDTVLELCTQMRDNGLAKNINLHEITAAHLTTETLLSLNPKRIRGEWFKEEIRQLKGIDFILDTLVHLANDEVDANDEILGKIDRCMHLLENITDQNRTNQEYILRYNDSDLIDACVELLKLYKMEIQTADDDLKSKKFTSALSTIMKVIDHLTENATRSMVGNRLTKLTELTDLILYFISDLQPFINLEERSDVMRLCVCVLINMVESIKELRTHLMNESKLNTLLDTFYERIAEAQQIEQQADRILDHKQRKMTEALQNSLINQVITKSHKNMAHSIVAACIATLFGCMVQDNSDYRERLVSCLKQNSVTPLIDVLQKLLEFNQLAEPKILTSGGVDRVKRILKLFKQR